MNLIPVSALPKVGWIGGEPLDLARFDPIGPVPREIVADYTKPTGGLWCAPVVRAGKYDQIVGTEWTMRDYGGGVPFTLVRPHRGTRIVCVDGRADLAAVIARWPDTRTAPYADLLVPAGYHRDAWGRLRFGEQPPVRVDWPAMAADVDAVYVTQRAIGELNLPHEEQHLWGWDVPTVLFLNATFSPGRRIDPPDAATVAAMNEARLHHEIARAVRKKKITATQAEKITTLLAPILAGDPG